jgi:mannose-6-phosphate isomerase-like protein (cupin superfamily)
MPTLIEKPTKIPAHGNPPKIIEEFFGRVNTKEDQLSIAKMISPQGWSGLGQTPEFSEFNVVLRGTLRVESHEGILEIQAGQAVVSEPGEWVRYSTPHAGGAEYIAVCLPAFSPETVHRDA